MLVVAVQHDMARQNVENDSWADWSGSAFYAASLETVSISDLKSLIIDIQHQTLVSALTAATEQAERV